MSKVLIMESDYARCAEAVERAFAAFPLDIKGKKVAVKVNALRACDPDREPIVTHPALVGAVIRHLEGLQPARIVVGDSVGTESYGSSDHIFETTGLAEAAAPYYRNFSLNLTLVSLKEPFPRKVAVLRDILDADVYISLPKMKTHGLAMISGGIKNNYGLLAGAQKSWYHFYSEDPEVFARILIEMYCLRPPDLTIMDAILAMEGYGPCSPETRRVNRILAAADVIALDSVEAHLQGFSVDEVPCLRLARKMGLGKTDLASMEIIGDASPVEGYRRPIIAPESTYCYLSGVGGGKTSRAFYADRISQRPVFAADKCRPGCTLCVDVCPTNALTLNHHPPILSPSACILCSACKEACAFGAIELLPNGRVLQ
jgi:uncharacterized protein (DUF362 family)/NAD-dependent dihydropyrimidine dehydrogenase PreA subunit